jgi:hypothetical protein
MVQIHSQIINGSGGLVAATTFYVGGDSGGLEKALFLFI